MTFRGSLSALTISKSGLSLTPGDYFPPKRFKSAESQSTLGWPTSLTFTPRPELEPGAESTLPGPAKKSGVTNYTIVNGQLIKCHNNWWPATESEATNTVTEGTKYCELCYLRDDRHKFISSSS